MTHPFVLALLLILAGCTAPEAQRSAALQAGATTPPTEVASPTHPAPQAPFDNTPITAMETVGAARSE